MFLNESFNRVFLNLSHSKAVPIALKWNENTWHIKVGKAEFYLYSVWLSNECSLRWNELIPNPYEYKILHDNFSESKWLVSTNVCPSFVIYPTQLTKVRLVFHFIHSHISLFGDFHRSLLICVWSLSPVQNLCYRVLPVLLSTVRSLVC